MNARPQSSPLSPYGGLSLPQGSPGESPAPAQRAASMTSPPSSQDVSEALRSPKTGEIPPSKTSPKIEHLISEMLLNPTLSKAKLAERLGVSVSWLWTVTRTDAFQALLSARAELVYSEALVTIRDKMERTAEAVLERLEGRVATGLIDTEDLIKVAELVLDRTGHGAQTKLTTTVNVQGRVQVQHRSDIIDASRQAILEKNRQARRRALGLTPEEVAEATDAEFIEGNGDEAALPARRISSGGADSASAL